MFSRSLCCRSEFIQTLARFFAPSLQLAGQWRAATRGAVAKGRTDL
jgi:hypothetical protein